MGFVTFGKHDLVWERASRPGSYFIRDLNTASRKLDRYRTDFTGTSRREGDALLLDALGELLKCGAVFRLPEPAGAFVYWGRELSVSDRLRSDPCPDLGSVRSPEHDHSPGGGQSPV